VPAISETMALSSFSSLLAGMISCIRPADDGYGYAILYRIAISEGFEYRQNVRKYFPDFSCSSAGLQTLHPLHQNRVRALSVKQS
jgi:hypothetical protein